MSEYLNDYRKRSRKVITLEFFTDMELYEWCRAKGSSEIKKILKKIKEQEK